MKSQFFRAATLSLLALVWTSTSLSAERRQVADSLSALERRTILLNFVNGLHLTLEQVDSLLAVAQEAESLRVRHERDVRRQKRNLERSLRSLQSFLEAELPVPDSLKRVVHRAKSRLGEERTRFVRAQAELTRRAVAVLTPNQLYLARTFKPCLIPPKVGAIGQDRGVVPGRLEKALRRLRQVPDWRYPRLKNRFVTAEIARERKKGLLIDSVQVVERRQALEEQLDEIRAMSEPRFLRELPSLVEALNRPTGKKRVTPSGEARAGRFLLDPEIVPILAAKRAALAEQADTTSTAEAR